jgi:hypothetical protein
MILKNEEGLHHVDRNLANFRDQITNEPPNTQILGEIKELKGYFERKIKAEINVGEGQIPNRVRQITDEGKEIVCQMIKEESEQTRNMIKFINMDAKKILEQLEQRGVRDRFHDYAQNIINHQESIKEKIEQEHKLIYEKEEENRTMMESMKRDIQKESQERMLETQQIIITCHEENQRKIIENQEETMKKQEQNKNEIIANQIISSNNQRTIIESHELMIYTQKETKKMLQEIGGRGDGLPNPVSGIARV